MIFFLIHIIDLKFLKTSINIYLWMVIKVLPAIEGGEINDIPEIVAFAALQESRQHEADQRRAPGEEAVLEVCWRIIATR